MNLGRTLGLPVALILTGCATQQVPPAPLSAATAAANLTARSLHDPDLHRFLAENLGHDPAEWDFEALSWVAFYYHPSLNVARAQWATARAVQTSAGVRPNPTLSLVPGYSTTHEAGISPWFPAINFDFLIQTARKRGYLQAVAQADAEAARLAVFSAAWQVRSDLRRALADASVAVRRDSLLRAQAAVQQRLLTLLEQRLAAGAVGAAEVSPARTAMYRAQSAAADAASQAITARARIAAALGLPLAALDGVALVPPSVPRTFSDDELAAARQLSLQSRSDVLAALAKYAATQATLELEIAKQQPDFHLGPGYQWDQGVTKWSLALTFELPIFHRNEAAIAEAVARRAEAAAQFGAVQAQAVANVDAAMAAQRAAAAQLDYVRRLRGESEKLSALAGRRLELGAADQVEVQSAQLDLATAETLSADAENAAALAAGQLEDALQVPFNRLDTLADSTRVNPTPKP
ncbi:MAG: Cobalt-zinc-cadmium resistance protein CzcC [Verrucomicrobia bacterium]|nr:Cobalt-zinc-cadmium resistance protein CzcC [Verrucomicrobiota bacterium]